MAVVESRCPDPHRLPSQSAYTGVGTAVPVLANGQAKDGDLFSSHGPLTLAENSLLIILTDLILKC